MEDFLPNSVCLLILFEYQRNQGPQNSAIEAGIPRGTLYYATTYVFKV